MRPSFTILTNVKYSSSSRPTRTSLSTSRPMAQPAAIKPPASAPTSTTVAYQRKPAVADGAPQPNDLCPCGGRWSRRENSDTGGRFWGCANYPRCKNTRDEVMRSRNGPYWREAERPELAKCSNGHLRTPRNTEYSAGGRRICLDCKASTASRASTRTVTAPAKAQPKPQPPEARKSSNSLSTNCRNGHPRTPENTYVRPDGSRECSVCRRNARRK